MLEAGGKVEAKVEVEGGRVLEATGEGVLNFEFRVIRYKI